MGTYDVSKGVYIEFSGFEKRVLERAGEGEEAGGGLGEGESGFSSLLANRLKS
jgi:hypothetical protein